MCLCTSEVEHRSRIEGRICGNDGDGIETAVVSVGETLADISENGKADCDGL